MEAKRFVDGVWVFDVDEFDMKVWSGVKFWRAEPSKLQLTPSSKEIVTISKGCSNFILFW